MASFAPRLIYASAALLTLACADKAISLNDDAGDFNDTNSDTAEDNGDTDGGDLDGATTDGTTTADTGSDADDGEVDTGGDAPPPPDLPDPPPDLPDPPPPPPESCPALEFHWEIELGEGRIDALARSSDGGLLAIRTDIPPWPSAEILRVDIDGGVQATIDRPLQAGEGDLNLAHVIADPSGGFSVFAMQDWTPTVEHFDAANQSQWSWILQNPGEGETANALARGPDGRLAVAGEDFFLDDLWIFRFDLDGNPSPKIGAPSPEPLFNMHPGGLDFEQGGDMLIAGWIVKGGGNDLHVARLDPAGAIQWQAPLVGGDWVVGVHVDADNHVFVVTNTSLHKLDASGELLWTEALLGGGATASALLGQRDPVVAISEGQQRRLQRFTGDGDTLEQLAMDTLTVAMAGGSDCRLAAGAMFPARISQFSAEL